MPGHLRVSGLTGDLPASLSAPALTGLLRGELGFTGVIVSDALEMRAVSGPFGIPEAAVLAVAAGVDLLCFGRDQDRLTCLQVRDALVTAVRSGRLPAARLEESAARVAQLRAWTRAARQAAEPAQADTGQLDVGLTAARRALRIEGMPPPMADPVLVELVPPSNIAVGAVPWGLGQWVRPGQARRIDADGSDEASAARAATAADAALTVAA